MKDLTPARESLDPIEIASRDEIEDLAHDLQEMAIQPPDPALTEALATDLAAAVADGDLSPQEMAQLARAVEAVMASAGIDADEMAVLIPMISPSRFTSGPPLLPGLIAASVCR